MADIGGEAGSSAHRLWFGTALAACVLAALHVRYPIGPVGEGTYMVATIGGAILAFIGLAGRPQSRHWRWVAVAIGLSGAAEITAWLDWMLLHREPPDVSVADAFWLASYVALGLGLSGIFGLRGPRARYRDIDALIDMAGSGIVGLLAVWVFALEPTMSDTSIDLFTRVVWSIYPILDVAMLTALVGGMLVVRRRSWATLLLGSGVACWLVSDFGFVVVESIDYTDANLWLDLGWMFGAVFLGLAVCLGAYSRPVDEERAVDAAAGRVRLAVGIAMLLVPSALEIVEHGGEKTNPWPFILATGALAFLVFARCARLLRGKDEAAAELDASERYYRTLATNSSDAVLVVSHAGRILRESSTFARLMLLPEPIVGTDVTAMTSIVDPQVVRDVLSKAAVVPGQLIAEELLVRHPVHGERCYSLRVMDMVQDESIGGVVVNLHDITERKHMEDVLRNQAFHDSLTGLANRALFRDRVGHVLELRGGASNASVAFIDLDEFKYINDTLGHDAGDQLLRKVADRLLRAVRPGDTVARLGGDEFAVLMESGQSPADAPKVAERVLEALREPIDIAGRSLLVSCSIGIAHADDRSDTSSLLRHADMAMYRAKSSGKARWALYEPSMGDASRERMDLEGELHGALDARQFELLYQPIFQIDSGHLTGFEALLRWRHPTLGTIAPDRFIPLLEGNGQIVSVGAWVLETACQTAARWSADQPSHDGALSMAVNVSSVQLASPRFVPLVQEVLLATGIDASTLVLEITETSLVNDPETAAARLAKLHALGVKIAIDDFGTGYSSLSYLRQFPTDILKIDSSFVQTIEADRSVPPLVKGILDLARTLGIETVAEGIEEAHQLAKLRIAKCDKGQGYFFAKPLSITDASRLLRDEAARRDQNPSGLRAPGTAAVRG